MLRALDFIKQLTPESGGQDVCIRWGVRVHSSLKDKDGEITMDEDFCKRKDNYGSWIIGNNREDKLEGWGLNNILSPAIPDKDVFFGC